MDQASSGVMIDFGDARGAVLARLTAPCDLDGRAAGPGLEPEAAKGEMVTVRVEVGDDLQQVPNLGGAAAAVRPEVAGIGVEQILVDAGEVDGAKACADEREETASAVEGLANAPRRQLQAVARKIDVEPRVEKGA